MRYDRSGLLAQADLVERIDTAFGLAAERQAADAEARDAREKFARLTARELEIVERMVARPAQISSKEVAAALGISPRTVDHHRARILEKLCVKSVAELIALASR